MVQYSRLLICLFLSLPLVVNAEVDPWEGLNRKTDGFNDWVDRKMLRPTAKAYQKVVPRFLRVGIGNVFDNVGTPAVALNQLLQGKVKKSLSDSGRFLLNTTAGFGGLIDVATIAGLAKHDEDFGQTFGVWGVGSGNYLVLPFMGSSTVRDSTGLLLNTLINPLGFISPVEDRAAVTALYVVDLRAELLGVDELVMGDRYMFLRDAYLQRRAFMVTDGVLEDDPFAEDDFDFDDE